MTSFTILNAPESTKWRVGSKPWVVPVSIGDPSPASRLQDDTLENQTENRELFFYTGTATFSTISRKISSACCDFLSMDE